MRLKHQLGALYTVDDLLGRCWIDPNDTGHDTEDGPCWHYRTARGRKLAQGKEFNQHRVWVPVLGAVMNVVTAAWSLGRPDEPVRTGWVRYRACASHDCVNPSHMRKGSKTTAMRAAKKRGAMNTPARVAMLDQRRTAAIKLTGELEEWAVQSTQGHRAVAWGLMVGCRAVRGARSRAKAKAERTKALQAASSIFGLAQATTE